MPRKKLRVVSMDEVKIRREGDAAIFEYADESLGGCNLKIGPELQSMSDEELLDSYNEMVREMEASRRNYEHIATEIPLGKSQIEYNENTCHWIAKGEVLRCYIGEEQDPQTGIWEPEIEIDDKKLSWREFGKLISVFTGWGMRIVIVPDDELHETPKIQIGEPFEDPPE